MRLYNFVIRNNTFVFYLFIYATFTSVASVFVNPVLKQNSAWTKLRGI